MHTYLVGDGRWVVHNVNCSQVLQWAATKGINVSDHFLDRIGERAKNLNISELEDLLKNGEGLWDNQDHYYGLAKKLGNKGWYTVWYASDGTLVTILDENAGSYVRGSAKFSGGRWVAAFIHDITHVNPFENL